LSLYVLTYLIVIYGKVSKFQICKSHTLPV